MSRPSRARTYAEALEDFGGQPWRTLDGTEQWFLVEEPDHPREPDTASFRIPRPSNRWWLVLGAATVAGALCAVLVGSAVATPAQPPPPPAQIQVVAPPPPVAPAVAMAQVTPPASTVTQPPRAKPAPIKRPLKHRRRPLR
jgi:hypothetical protein